MILTIVYYLLITTLYLLLTLILLILSIVIWLKLKYEPVKGVCKSNAKLDGKIALVTGANQGIGMETARELAARGARVIIACRDADKAAQVIADITAATGNEDIEYRYLDLTSFSNIRKFAEDFNSRYDRLDILVNNAGCAGLMPKLTEDGVDVVMQVNYLGPFLLTNLLLDKVISSKPSRIVIVSSCFHDFARLHVDKLGEITGPGWIGQFMQYCNSKLCDVLWMKVLAKRLPAGVTVNALHPGAVRTNIFKRLHPVLRKITETVVHLFFKTAKEGAQTTVHVCVSEQLENVSGKYFMECQEAGYNKTADNDELVERVWNKSNQLTN